MNHKDHKDEKKDLLTAEEFRAIVDHVLQKAAAPQALT